MNEERRIGIHSEYIKLEALLKYTGIVSTGGEGKILIGEGRVFLNGEPCFQRGRKITPGDMIEIAGVRIVVTKEMEKT